MDDGGRRVTKAFVLGRRRKGRPIEAAVADTASRLEAAGWTVTSSVVDGKGDLRRETKKAVAAGVDIVVAVGGDGAVLQVIQKLAGPGSGGGKKAKAAKARADKAEAGEAEKTEPGAAEAGKTEPGESGAEAGKAEAEKTERGEAGAEKGAAENPGAENSEAGKTGPDLAGVGKVALGIVPMGTGNLLAGNLGIPRGVDKAVEVLLGQRQQIIDLGQVVVGGKKRLFSVACGVGFDAEVMDATAKSTKRRFGKLAYFASALGRGRKMTNADHEITIDGEQQTGPAAQVFVANFGGMGFAMEPQLEIKPDDGVLDVIVVRAGGPIEGLLAGWEAIRQRRHGHTRSGRVFRTHALKVKIAVKGRRRLVETDGSVIGKTPVEVSIRPLALSVLVPVEP